MTNRPRPLGRAPVALALALGLAAAAGALAVARAFPVGAARLHDGMAGSLGLDGTRFWHPVAEIALQFLLLAGIGTLAYGAVIAAASGRRPRLLRLIAAAGMMMAPMLAVMAVMLLTPLPVAIVPLFALIGYFATGLALRDWVLGPRGAG